MGSFSLWLQSKRFNRVNDKETSKNQSFDMCSGIDPQYQYQHSLWWLEQIQITESQNCLYLKGPLQVFKLGMTGEGESYHQPYKGPMSKARGGLTPPPTRLRATDHNTLGLVIHPVFIPPHCGLIYACNLSVCLWWCHGIWCQRLYLCWG